MTSEFMFGLAELQRLLRLYADKQTARYGITRAQWAVLAKLERFEGMTQSDLAEQMDMQPITLTRLVDRLCDNDLIERRSDPADRRVNRLFLRKPGRALATKLAALRTEITRTALGNMSRAEASQFVAQLTTIKDNIRDALQDIESRTEDANYG